MESYITVKQLGEYVFTDRKSEFIGYALPIKNEAEALDFIASIKKRYPDARHWVYAYVLRENSTMRFTDDREPQGTAGMPVLDSMRKRNITDTVVVVVRYFGGILLGTGGLVHAYTEAAAGALSAAGIITYDLYSSYEIVAGYSDYQRLTQIFDEKGFSVLDTEYSDSVKVFGSLPSANRDDLISALTEATGARVKVSFMEEKFSFRE